MPQHAIADIELAGRVLREHGARGNQSFLCSRSRRPTGSLAPPNASTANCQVSSALSRTASAMRTGKRRSCVCLRRCIDHVGPGKRRGRSRALPPSSSARIVAANALERRVRYGDVGHAPRRSRVLPETRRSRRGARPELRHGRCWTGRPHPQPVRGLPHRDDGRGFRRARPAGHGAPRARGIQRCSRARVCRQG